MVIGEDQILGQVKDAHKNGAEIGNDGVYLNTFFRMAVTAAKKVKTDTDLSKTSVSTATLAIKVAEEALGTLTGEESDGHRSHRKDRRYRSDESAVRLQRCAYL